MWGQVLQQLQDIILAVMGRAIDSSAPLMAAGLDSLAAVELRNAVSSRFGISLPATLAFDYPTLDALSQAIATSLSAMSRKTAQGNFSADNFGIEKLSQAF